MERLQAILKGYYEYPAKYRFVLMSEFLLKLCTVIGIETKPAVWLTQLAFHHCILGSIPGLAFGMAVVTHLDRVLFSLCEIHIRVSTTNTDHRFPPDMSIQVLQ